MDMYNKHILEAINKGVKLALDNFDDIPIGQSISKVKANDLTTKYLDLLNDFVDLGLPSGTLWCKYNLGAEYKDKDDYTTHWFGDFYNWGSLTKNKLIYAFTEDTYDKYNENDKLTILKPEDDIAYQTNHLYRIPTKEQCEELIKYTTVKFITQYNNHWDYNGLLLISTINGNQIFFPCTGYRSKSFYEAERSTLYNRPREGKEICLWTINIGKSTWDGETLYKSAYVLRNDENFKLGLGMNARNTGCFIRPVVKL